MTPTAAISAATLLCTSDSPSVIMDQFLRSGLRVSYSTSGITRTQTLRLSEMTLLFGSGISMAIVLSTISKLEFKPDDSGPTVACHLTHTIRGKMRVVAVVCSEQNGFQGSYLTELLALRLGQWAGCEVQGLQGEEGSAVRAMPQYEPQEVPSRPPLAQSWTPSPPAPRTEGQMTHSQTESLRREARTGGRPMLDAENVTVPMTEVEMVHSVLNLVGLGDMYSEAIVGADISYEDLKVVTREDLAELVGITNRLHQLKIISAIKQHLSELRKMEQSLQFQPCPEGSNFTRATEDVGNTMAGSVIDIVGVAIS